MAMEMPLFPVFYFYLVAGTESSVAWSVCVCNQKTRVKMSPV